MTDRRRWTGGGGLTASRACLCPPSKTNASVHGAADTRWLCLTDARLKLNT